jgi:hypothetical protein
MPSQLITSLISAAAGSLQDRYSNALNTWLASGGPPFWRWDATQQSILGNRADEASGMVSGVEETLSGLIKDVYVDCNEYLEGLTRKGKLITQSVTGEI